MEEPRYCFLQFKLSYKTIPCEEVRVVGNIPELGDWDPMRGERLVTSKLDYPLWKTKENIKVRQNTEIQYKYVIFKNGRFDRWENLPNNANRILNLKNMIRIIIHDIQGTINSKIEKFTRLNSGEKDYTRYEPFEDEDLNKFDFREPKIKKYFLTNDLFHPRLSFTSIRETMQNMSIKGEEELKELNYEPEEEIYCEEKKFKREVLELNSNDRIIMASLFLPLTAVKNENEDWDLQLTNDPLYNTLYKLCEQRGGVIWVGLLKNYHEIKNENERDTLISKLQKKYNMYVVKLSEDSCYLLHKLNSAILEPMFQYITIFHDIEQIKEFEMMWKSYKEFNELISKIIASNLADNSMVFLHDYHFFLAPTFIYNSHQLFNSKIFKNVAVGLFIHAPFPSHEVFRRFPFREEILKSMMNCSIIGFHTFDSSRNFLTSCRRLLLINSMSSLKGDLALSYYGRKVIIRVKHISSTPEFIFQETQSDLFKQIYNDIKNKYENKYIFVSVDNMLFLAGIRHKMEGYKRFLRDIGDNYKQNVLIQYIDSSQEAADYMNGDVTMMKKSIYDLAQSIKREFGDDVIQVVEKNVSYTERLAILAAGKCYVKSSKRESFSLDIYEFLNLKVILNDTFEMGYILSDLSGVTSSLSAAIKVNPFDIQSIKKGFEMAFQVHFDKEEISFSQQKDLIHVKKNNANLWMTSFLKELKNSFNDDNDTYYLGAGIGLNFRLMKISSTFKELDKPCLIKDYENSKRRLILLDYEGTLPSANSHSLEYQSKGLQPCHKILNTLDDLTKDKRNTIFIVTGREAKLVSEWFLSVPDLGLASEHGFLYRYNTNLKARDKWDKMLRGFNGDWRSNCSEQLVPYTERCEGSFIEVKECSVVWQYSNCDPELGKSMAQVLTSELEKSFMNLRLQVINGKGYVEVKPMGINKGAFASFILKQEILRKRPPDFILTIGDDTSDEEMFIFFKKKLENIKKYSKNLKLHTVTVGKKPSSAQAYVDTTSDVRIILETFMQISNRKRMSSSTFNIRGLGLQDVSTTLSNDHKNANIFDERLTEDAGDD